MKRHCFATLLSFDLHLETTNNWFYVTSREAKGEQFDDFLREIVCGKKIEIRSECRKNDER